MLEIGKGDPSNQHLLEADLPSPGPSHLPSHNLSHLPVPQTSQDSIAESTPRYEQRQPKRRKLAGTVDLSRIGFNMETQGHGLFKPPYPRRRVPVPISSAPNLPELPPKEVADTLIRFYHYTLHPTLPMLHWPSFQEQYNSVYEAKSLSSVPRIWTALLFAVFACGTLHRSWRNGQMYMETSRSLIDMWSEDLELDHVRTSLLHAIFSVEINFRSAAWVWIGSAVRIAFDIGLHCEAGTWSPIEEEMRRRVWWTVYTCDW